MTSKKKQFGFEKALSELNKIVETMEQGELELEQSLQEFERGIVLIRECQQALGQAEQKVSLLVKKGENAELADFDTESQE